MAAHLNSEEVLNEAKKIIFKFHDYYDSQANLLPWVVEAISKDKGKKTYWHIIRSSGFTPEKEGDSSSRASTS